MEITSRNASELPPAMAVDITRPTREQIQEREPLTPPQVRRPEAPVDAARASEAGALETESDARAVDRARADATEQVERGSSSDPARPRADEVEISPRTRQVMEQALARLRSEETESNERAQRVETLKRAYERGELATDERVARAAEGLLAGE